MDPFPYLAIAKDVAGYIKAHDIVLNNYDFDTLVGGHLTRLGTRNDVIVQKEFVSDLQKAAAKANQEVIFSKIASQVGSSDNPRLIFSKYIDAVNANCVKICCLNGKLDWGERESLWVHIALRWLSLEELILLLWHQCKIVCLYINESTIHSEFSSIFKH